ncbi:ATP-dependent DNA helicase RECG [Salix suchowensis]|nr:ATP-dependent DNA helicase RECG [Salix suchowensis]
MNWAGKAKHYGAFIVIISPAFGYQPSLISPHAHTDATIGFEEFYCIIYSNSECPAHVLILFLMAPIPSAMKSYGFCCSGKWLTTVIFSKAERGYRNDFGCRFDNFIFGVLKLRIRSKHTSKERLFEEVYHHVELHDEPDIYGLLAATSLEGCLPIAMEESATKVEPELQENPTSCLPG